MNDVHPSVHLVGDVQLGEGNTICAGVSLIGPIEIGSNNYIGPGVSIGAISRERIDPSHRLDEPLVATEAKVIIGSNAMIFDNTVIHKPMFEETRVEDRVELGALTLVAHDCVIRDAAILSPNTTLGAYVTVGASANLGLSTTVHNRLAIGAHAMCGLGSAVVGHVPVAALVYGNPARIHDANTVGLKRANFSTKECIEIREMLLLGSGMTHARLRELNRQYALDVAKWPNGKREVRWSTPPSS